jgi:cold shock CspA family protein
MVEGIVKFFDHAGGYGFITGAPGGPDVFVHSTSIEMDGYRYLATGERVLYEFEHVAASEDGQPRLQATRVAMDPDRIDGTIVEFDQQRGFGFIESAIGERFFVHHTGLLEGGRQADSGGRVTFVPQHGEPDRRATAVKLADPRPALYRFAQLPRREEWLPKLAALAEPEDWSFKHERAGEGRGYPILHSYLVYTFARLKAQSDEGDRTILEVHQEGRDYACFDTGLATPGQQHIYAVFHANLTSEVTPWYLRGFYAKSDREFHATFGGEEPPELAEYFDDPAALIYDRRLQLKLDYEHVLRDNLDRFPEVLRDRPALARNALMGAEAQIRDRVYRNYKTAIPQYYAGRIQLLLPLCLQEDGKADLALVVERDADGRTYRGNTVLTLDMAYSNARLLARPDRDWLRPEEAALASVESE